LAANIEKIILKSGAKPLLLEKLLVRRTYEGVLEGRSDDATNARLISQFVSWVRQVTENQSPHVIDPDVDASKGYPRLPEYACAIELMSFQPAIDSSADMSSAVVVWFQSQSPSLVGARIVEHLEQLSWSDIATDGHW